MSSIFLFIASIYGALSVAIGAFGAHALDARLEQIGKKEHFITASRYQFYHVFALLIVGLLMRSVESKALVYSGWAFTIGIPIFCGTLYAIALTGKTGFGAIAPIGGLLFILGWVFLAVGTLKI